MDAASLTRTRRHPREAIVDMEEFTIHASKDGEWVETQGSSPTLIVAKATSLHKSGWDVHITDSEGRRYGPSRFNEILSFDRKPSIKF
jgi:hypothetical protein